MRVELELSAAFVEAVAARVLELVELAAPAAVSPYLDIDEAAIYIRAFRIDEDGNQVPDKQRVYDLRSSGRLTKVGDGSRALVLRSELDDLVAPGLPPGPRARSRTGVAA